MGQCHSSKSPYPLVKGCWVDSQPRHILFSVEKVWQVKNLKDKVFGRCTDTAVADVGFPRWWSDHQRSCEKQIFSGVCLSTGGRVFLVPGLFWRRIGYPRGVEYLGVGYPGVGYLGGRVSRELGNLGVGYPGDRVSGVGVGYPGVSPHQE